MANEFCGTFSQDYSIMSEMLGRLHQGKGLRPLNNFLRSMSTPDNENANPIKSGIVNQWLSYVVWGRPEVFGWNELRRKTPLDRHEAMGLVAGKSAFAGNIASDKFYLYEGTVVLQGKSPVFEVHTRRITPYFLYTPRWESEDFSASVALGDDVSTHWAGRIAGGNAYMDHITFLSQSFTIGPDDSPSRRVVVRGAQWTEDQLPSFNGDSRHIALGRVVDRFSGASIPGGNHF